MIRDGLKNEREHGPAVSVVGFPNAPQPAIIRAVQKVSGPDDGVDDQFVNVIHTVNYCVLNNSSEIVP